MKIKLNLTIAFIFLLCAGFLHSQTADTEKKYEITGKITDDITGEPLIGANVLYAPGKGVQTDTAGGFHLMLPNGRYDLKISYIGYNPMAQKVHVDGQPKTLEPVSLLSANNLEEVEVAADVARTRETPVAFSDIDQKQISEEMGSNDITMLLNSTPGAYASQQGGGAGDSRLNIRGFDQRNIAVLVDGVPVNDMENGQVYWSNWAGLSEITKKMQVQRGLGASRLAVPSVGGVMNFITTTVDQKQFFTVKENLGTANYQRFSAAYNSGLIRNRFGVILAGSYTSGDGYIDQTWQKTFSYFAKASYKFSDKHLLVASVNGAPQSHGQRSYAINPVYHDKAFAQKQGVNADSIYALPYTGNPYTNSKIGARGIQYSPDWGYINGKPFNAKINYFNKPLANISDFWTINPRLMWSNVLYYSNGSGGGTTLSSFPQYDKNGTGQLNLQGEYDVNSGTATGTLVPGQRVSSYYQYSKVNNHNWLGGLSTLKYRHSSTLDFLGGLDGRYYIGTHYETPYDMMGGDYILSSSNLNVNPADQKAQVVHVGDKMAYYYQSKITWAGLFGQAEYKSKKITAFITATGNRTGFQIENYFAKKDIVLNKNTVFYNAVGYGDTLYTDGANTGVKAKGFPVTHNSDGTISFRDAGTGKTVTMSQNAKTYNGSSPEARTNTSPVKTYYGYTVKGGFNYKLDGHNNIFINVGHMSLTPRFSNVYDQSGATVGNITNQLIFSNELGYTAKYKDVSLNVNGYITSWGNKPLDYPVQSLKVDPVTNSPIYFNVPGVNALLKGLEFDLNYKPYKYVQLRVFGAIADWRWNSAGTAYAFTESGVKLDSIKFDAKGVHIANAPQQQLGASVRFEIARGFYIKPQFTYFNKMYAQFDPTKLGYDPTTGKDFSRTDSWKMPGFGLVDLYLGYRIMNNSTKVEITAVMNNVLNTVYMTDASFSTTPNNYNALNAYGWMGLGRRINIGVKVTF